MRASDLEDGEASTEASAEEGTSRWRAFELKEEIERLHGTAIPYREFLRVPSMSCGVYELSAGATDLQAPHDEDEVYFVVSGRGRVRVDGAEKSVSPGSVLFVGATADHSFFEIEEDMTLLVFFASGGPG